MSRCRSSGSSRSAIPSRTKRDNRRASARSLLSPRSASERAKRTADLRGKGNDRAGPEVDVRDGFFQFDREAAGVMMEMIPSVEFIIGRQPPVSELSGAEAQNRFNNACRAYFRRAATAERPLILFLDDLKWADLASLNLMSVLLTDKRITHLFLIGAYRDNETSPTHPLILTVQELGEKGLSPVTIDVGNLSEQDVAALCADALRSTPEEVAALAHLVHTRTLGNPFFFTQFLRALSVDGLIRPVPSGAGWQWDMESIAKRSIPDDVVQLMAGKITALGSEAQSLLTSAACICDAFSLEIVYSGVRTETTPSTTMISGRSAFCAITGTIL